MKLIVTIIFGVILMLSGGDMRVLLIEAAILILMFIHDDTRR